MEGTTPPANLFQPDEPTMKRIESLHPLLRAEAKTLYKEICLALTGKAICRFAYTLRTWAEQDALYAQGRTKPGNIVTKAKAGESFHNYGLAVDIVLLIDKDGNGSHETASWDEKTDFDGDHQSDWMEVVGIFKKYGWEWGGDWHFKDSPHFQKTFGNSIANLKQLFATGKVDPNKYVLLKP
jgi:peptidoglycan L-alanyl-D-glutamate endopeptidase CwlK